MIELKKSPVRFDEEAHRYWLGEKELNGVTSTLIKRAFPNKYSDIPEDILANAARKGHELHAQIEFHDQFKTEPENIRIENYERIKKENGMTVIANEYLVSDEERYASSIDIVMVNEANEICLVDTKTTWNLDKNSTALQLSIYKKFFEMQNVGLQVKHIYVLWLPNKDENVAEFHELRVVPPDMIDALIEADMKSEDFVYNPLSDNPDWYPMLEQDYAKWNAVKTTAEQNLIELKKQLMKKMEAEKVTQIKSDLYTVSYIPAKKSKKFDSAAFKKENKEMYDRYQKETETAASIRFVEHKEDKE